MRFAPAILACSFCFSAQAAEFQLLFSATGFADRGGTVAAPFATIGGSFTFSAVTPGAQIQAISSLALQIGDHDYTLAEVSFVNGLPQAPNGTAATIGIAFPPAGLVTTTAGSNDFVLQFDRLGSFDYFEYSVAGATTTWFNRPSSGVGTATMSITAIPEPSSVLLMVFGIAILAARRR